MIPIRVEVRPKMDDEEGNLAPRILKPELLLSRIDEIGDSLRAIAAKLSQRLDELAAHPENRWRLGEVELKFSLDLEAEAGVIIARTSGSVGFEATLTWNAPPQGEEP
jgi:Trypsin-co-occurring domain 1